jgi:drug/metabolite transporter (DMT)-like permease
MSLLWGIPYLLIRIAVADLSPVVLVFARTAIGALVLAPLAIRLRAFVGLRPLFGWLIVLTMFEVTVPFLLISFGEQHISSSLTGLLIASVPLLVAILAMRVDASERVHGWRLAGLLIGLAGVALVLGLDLGGDRLALLGGVMILLASLCYAAGVLVIRLRLGGVSQVGVAIAPLIVNSIVLAVPAALLAPHTVPPLTVILAVVVLGVACTGGAFVAYFTLIQEAGAARASVVTYINPAVAVALGALLLHEPIGPATIAGFVLIVLGSWLATTGGRLPWQRQRTAEIRE